MNAARWRAVQDLFLAARERPASERAEFVRAATPNDSDLAADVNRMLAADTSEGILDRDAPTFALLGSPSDDPVQERVGPYLIDGEIGRGGMGVVYRAYDPRLRRDVALKFLPGAWNHDHDAKGRFINEARAASALDHPHTCPVYDIGSTDDGRSYIAMAYCAGGSLAHRLSSGPLPIDQAVEVAVAVASALDRAHNAGIIHRDIKPGNIAFTEHGYARVLDFGVAVLGTGEWATPSIAAGTPAYMAPEQVRGDAVDRRTDVWALGVVLFEMLTGRRAFSGARREVTEAILHGEPNDLRALRPEVPQQLAAAVRRAISKNPDDRFATAAEFSAAITAALVAKPTAAVRGQAGSGRIRRLAFAAAAIVAMVVGGLGVWRSRKSTSSSLSFDPNAVVILPFRVRGESSMQYLREGMVDLLASKLTGEGGLRAADPRSVYAGWRRVVTNERDDLGVDSAVALARRLGAGKVLLGDVVGTANGIVVNASIMSDRRVVGRATAQGTHNELSTVVDRLVAQLLSVTAGEEPQRLGALTSTSLPALRAYLEGQAAYRRGRYADALEKFGRAVDFDSTFALAGLGLSLADGWVGTGHARDRGRAIAWAWRNRLSVRDRALLKVALGPAYPRAPTIREQLAATEEALRLSPDRMELWYNLGDLYFHHGKLIGDDNWERDAERAMRRAIEADSAFAPPLLHMVGMYARQGRLDDMRAIVNASRASVGADGSTADFIHWRAGVALGLPVPDTSVLDSMATEVLGWVGLISQDDGITLPFGERAIRVRAARPSTREERFERALSVHASALNAGRPYAAGLSTESIRAHQPDSAFYLRLRVLAAIYGDGNRLAAEHAYQALGSASTGRVWLNQCVRLQWRLWKLAAADSLPTDISLAGPTGSALDEQMCEAAVHAIRAARQRNAAATSATARLDSILRSGVAEFYPGDGHVDYAHLALARALEVRGDRAGALKAVRRRPYFIGWQPFLATSLRHEARLAASLGDRDGAIRAYEHHLALRYDPEPPLRASVDSVRAELASLKAR